MSTNDDVKKLSVTANPNATALFSQNPQLSFSAADLQAIDAGTLVPIPNPKLVPSGGLLKAFGCIRTLRFQNGDDDLSYVEFDTGEYLRANENATNLNDFRETFKCAANHGYGVTACHYTKDRKINMVNLYSCRCTCDKRD